MNAIEALIQRMDQAPEEFAEDGSWKHTRWADITDIMIAESQMTPRVFTQEEVSTYMDKLGVIVRKQLEEHICIEILNPLRTTAEQLNLFPAQTAYPPGGSGSGGSGQVKFSHQDYRVTVGGSGGVTVDNSALRAMVGEQIQQQKDLKNHIALHQAVLKKQREKEREGVLRRLQNTINKLAKKCK